MSKRRRGFPSETNVKRGDRVVHGQKELVEKLGRRDPCPCGSGRLFQAMLPDHGPLSTDHAATTTCVIEEVDAITLELSIAQPDCNSRPVRNASRHPSF